MTKEELSEIMEAESSDMFPKRGEFVVNDEQRIIWDIHKGKKNEYHLYLYSEIFEPNKYTEVVNVLQNLTATDTFFIHINSQGGDFSTLLAFQSVLERTKAWTVAVVDGEADSSAFCLVFMCKEVYISEFSTLFTHNIIIDTIGKDVASVGKILKFSGELYRKLLIKYCSCVLLPEEIEAICSNSKEYYFYASEIIERLKKLKKPSQKPRGNGIIIRS